MFKGIRQKIQTTNNNNGKAGRVYYIKRKAYKYTASIRASNINGDMYIIAERSFYKDWHKNDLKQMIILHEFGHARYSFSVHFINEIFATIYGYYKHSHLAPLVGIMSIVKIIITSWRYMFRIKAPK